MQDNRAVSTYSAATGQKAIDPAAGIASLTKTTPAATDYTIAAPGAGNVGKTLRVYTVNALAHVVTVTGLVGGTTMTFGVTAGAGFTLFAVSATAWIVQSSNGVTQS